MNDKELRAIYESTGLMFVMGGNWDRQKTALNNFAARVLEDAANHFDDSGSSEVENGIVSRLVAGELRFLVQELKDKK